MKNAFLALALLAAAGLAGCANDGPMKLGATTVTDACKQTGGNGSGCIGRNRWPAWAVAAFGGAGRDGSPAEPAAAESK